MTEVSLPGDRTKCADGDRHLGLPAGLVTPSRRNGPTRFASCCRSRPGCCPARADNGLPRCCGPRRSARLVRGRRFARRGGALSAGRVGKRGLRARRDWQPAAATNGLEWSYGWRLAAAQRLRFLLDFGYATGLRVSELTASTLYDVTTDPAGNPWLRVIGKGHKRARVTLTPLAMVALEQDLLERGLPVSRGHCDPSTPLIGRVAGNAGGQVDGEDAREIEEGMGGITPVRLWEIMRRFFRLAADSLETRSPHAGGEAALRHAAPDAPYPRNARAGPRRGVVGRAR